jgi:hypothetical protein
MKKAQAPKEIRQDTEEREPLPFSEN